MATFEFSADTAANWASNNRTPLLDELCLETDTGRTKFGNGSTAYNNLAYVDGRMPQTNYLVPTGLTYETFPRQSAQSNTGSNVAASGVLFLVAIQLPINFTVGHIAFFSAGTAQATPTHWWFGLYDQNRVQLAVTADQTSTVWAANTQKSLAIATVASGAATSFTTTYTGLYYLGVMQSATTVANLAVTQVGTAVGAGPPILCGASSSGQTTPPAFAFTAGAISSGTVVPYAGVGA